MTKNIDQYKSEFNLEYRISFHEQFSTSTIKWYEWVFNKLTKLEFCNALEVGAGTGSLWLKNIERINGDWEIILSDNSHRMVNLLRKQIEPKSKKIKILEADILSLPFPAKTFDLVIANHMLYRTGKVNLAINECKRVLNSSGYLVASTIGENHLKELYAFLQKVKNDNRFLCGHLPENFVSNNGKRVLSQYFKQVDHLKYIDSLLISNLKCVFDYIKTTTPGKELNRNKDKQLLHLLNSYFKRNKYLSVSKDVSLFVCQNNI